MGPLQRVQHSVRFAKVSRRIGEVKGQNFRHWNKQEMDDEKTGLSPWRKMTSVVVVEGKSIVPLNSKRGSVKCVETIQNRKKRMNSRQWRPLVKVRLPQVVFTVVSLLTPEQPKFDKSKIVDVDSLFALEPPIPDENASTAPASSVFFDSAPTTGRASRFRQLFAQEPVPAPKNSFHSEPRPNAERMNSNPLFNEGPKPGASEEDREGFQRIMSMLGGAGNKPNMANVVILALSG
jgi:hypothetical protein